MKKNVQWEDYVWQLKNSAYSVDDLPIDKLSENEIYSLRKIQNKFIRITPYMYSLIDFDDYNCPIRKQIIPCQHDEYFIEDYLKESNYLKTPLVVQKHNNRVLFLVSNRCGFDCTFCTRTRLEHTCISKKLIDESIDFINQNDNINEVIISGGDPLVLTDKQLFDILYKLRCIPHVSVIRIGTRIPISLPMRVTESLMNILHQFAPIYLNIHINHPNEITDYTIKCFSKLRDAGAILGSQTVLLKGINDKYEVLEKLFGELIIYGVKPYYLFQCDKERGCESFVTDESIGINMINKLQKNLSGIAVPKYVLDTEENKIILGPNNMRRKNETEKT